MTKDELKAECECVRGVLELAAKQNILPDELFYGFPRGECLISSEALGIWLPRTDSNDCVELVSGWRGNQSHAWIEYNGLIIDITADQFPEIDEKVIITSKSQFHDLFCEDIKRRKLGKSSTHPSVNELLRFLRKNIR